MQAILFSGFSALFFFFAVIFLLVMWISGREMKSAERAAKATKSALEAAEAEAEKLAQTTKASLKQAEPQAQENEAPSAKEESSPTASAASVSPEEMESPRPKDDLTKIEGIGPKFQDLLNAAGVMTYAQLAALDEAKIVAIIQEQGGRKSASMASWAEQAQLATKGDWEALAALQAKLSGGRKSN